MTKCCIRGCNSETREKVEGVSFFRFPRIKALQKLWKDNIGTENIKPYKAARVCSKHFEDICINRTLDVVRLKDDVVPTLFPFTSSPSCSSSSGKHRGDLAMNIAGNTANSTVLLPVKMADDIDIEEHDVLDNPRIKNIFPDITCIKTDLMKYENEDINDFDEESYETYQQDLTDPEILECSVVLEDCSDSLKYNPCFCSDCEILFPTENALNSHKKMAHSYLAAVGRNKVIKSSLKSSISARLKFETDSNMEISNLCYHCNKVFPDEKLFLKHSYELLTGKFNCNVCDVEFKSEISLEQHLRTHPTVISYCCPICSCCFKVRYKLVSHMVRRHQVDMKEVLQRVETTQKCRFCPKIFKDIKSYNNHIQYVHTDLYKKIVKVKTHTDQFKSQSCNLTYPSKSCLGSKAERLKLATDLNMELSNLDNYCSQVLPDEKSRRKFSCTVCDLAFYSKISLEQHLRSISCLLYCCPICSCYYKFTSKIVTHMVYQHQIDVNNIPQPEKATFKCRFCAKIMNDNSAYNTHISNSHPEIFNKKSHEFKCQPCNLTFLSAYSEKLHRVSEHAIENETYSNSVDLDEQIKIEPLSPTISHRVSQHEIDAETSSKSVDLDEQIKIEPLSPTILYRVSQPVLKTYSKSINLDKQIKIEPLSPTISHRVSQHAIEAETYSTSIDLDKQIKIEPLSPTKSHRVSQHAIEAETYSTSIDLDEQIKIEPLSPTISHRVSQHEIEAEIYSTSIDLDEQIKIEPLSPTISHRVSQHEIEAEIYSTSIDLDEQIKIEPLSPTISHRVSQHEIEAEIYSTSIDLDEQIKIEPLSPTISHRVSQHEIEAEIYSTSIDLDEQIKIEPLSPTISHRVSQPVLKTYSKSINLDKQIKIEPLSPKITQTDLKQEL